MNRRKRPRDELVKELGEDLVEWGERLASVMDELPPENDKPPLDDAITSKSRLTNPPTGPAWAGGFPVDREHRDRRGNLLKCIVCGSYKTVDGKKCRRHHDE